MGKKKIAKVTKPKATKVRAGSQPVKIPKKVVEHPSVGKGLLGSLGRMAGGALGSLVGGPGGGALGSSILGSVGDFLGNITGMGAYKIKTNSLMGDSGPPAFSGDPGNFVLCHREFIQDIVGSVGFSLTSFPLNAGLLQSFPWLSPVAANFEQIRWLGLVFEFKSTCGNAVSSTNNSLGVVVASTNYDVLNPNFVDKQQMESYEYTTSCNPAQSMVHGVECAPSLTPVSTMYIRTATSLPAGADQRFYDLGNFQIATTGMQAAVTIGELWVSYHVELIKPKLPAVIGASIPIYHARPPGGGNFSLTTGSGGAIYPNGTWPVQIGSTMNLNASSAGGNTFSIQLFQQGNFLIYFTTNSVGNLCISSQWSASLGANISGYNLFVGGNNTGSAQSISTPIVTGANLQQHNNYMSSVYVSANGTAAANVITFTDNGLASGNSTWAFDIVVVQIPGLIALNKRGASRMTADTFQRSLGSLCSAISKMTGNEINLLEDGTVEVGECILVNKTQLQSGHF